MEKTGKNEFKSLANPDETRTFGHGKVEVVNVCGSGIGRITLEPGWRWSQDVKPLVNTEWCEAAHFQCLLSGRMHVLTSAGEEFDLVAGDVCFLPPGHDAWVIGEEPVVVIDWTGASNYAKQSVAQSGIAKAA